MFLEFVAGNYFSGAKLLEMQLEISQRLTFIRARNMHVACLINFKG